MKKRQKKSLWGKIIAKVNRICQAIESFWFFALFFMLDIARAILNWKNLLFQNDYNIRRKKMVKGFNCFKTLIGIFLFVFLMSQVLASCR